MDPGMQNARDIVALLSMAFGLELTLNWTFTGLIAGRLWYAGRRAVAAREGRKDEPFTRVVIAFLESGAIYSAATVVLLVLYAVKVSLQHLGDLHVRDLTLQLPSRRATRLSSSSMVRRHPGR